MRKPEILPGIDLYRNAGRYKKPQTWRQVPVLTNLVPVSTNRSKSRGKPSFIYAFGSNSWIFCDYGTQREHSWFWQCCGSVCFWVFRIRTGPSGPGSGFVVICTDPDLGPDPSIIEEKSKKNLDFYCFVTFSYFLSMKTDVDVRSKRKKRKKLFFVNLNVTMERSRIRNSVAR